MDVLNLVGEAFPSLLPLLIAGALVWMAAKVVTRQGMINEEVIRELTHLKEMAVGADRRIQTLEDRRSWEEQECERGRSPWVEARSHRSSRKRSRGGR